MISCIVFNCAGVNSYDPIRFAGTWKQYSKKAMPQLTTITFHSASLRNRKCPYHATVMKIFEIVSSRMRSEEHTSELQSQSNLVCRLLLEKKKKAKCTAARQSASPRRPFPLRLIPAKCITRFDTRIHTSLNSFIFPMVYCNVHTLRSHSI